MKRNLESKTSKNIFTYVTITGVALIILFYIFPFRIFIFKTQKIEEDNRALETNLSIWKQYYEEIDKYNQEMDEIKESIRVSLETYPADVREEDVVMLGVSLQENGKASISNININEPENIFFIGQEVATATNMEELTGDLEWNRLNASYVVNGDYESIKDCVRIIYSQGNNIGINGITVSKNENESLLGSINVSFYSMKGTSKEYVKPAIPAYIKGTDNIFGITGILEEEDVEENEDEDNEEAVATE